MKIQISLSKVDVSKYATAFSKFLNVFKPVAVRKSDLHFFAKIFFANTNSVYPLYRVKNVPVEFLYKLFLTLGLDEKFYSDYAADYKEMYNRDLTDVYTNFDREIFISKLPNEITFGLLSDGTHTFVSAVLKGIKTINVAVYGNSIIKD